MVGVVERVRRVRVDLEEDVAEAGQDSADSSAGCAVGSASFAIDAPNGGIVNIDSNQILQGDANQNGALIDYGSEGMLYADNSFAVSNTTLDNLGRKASIGIQERGGCYVPVSLSGDTFTNIATPVTPAGCSTGDPLSLASAVAAPAIDPPAADAVPEPSSCWLLLAALGGCLAWGAQLRASRSACPPPIYRAPQPLDRAEARCNQRLLERRDWVR